MLGTGIKTAKQAAKPSICGVRFLGGCFSLVLDPILAYPGSQDPKLAASLRFRGAAAEDSNKHSPPPQQLTRKSWCVGKSPPCFRTRCPHQRWGLYAADTNYKSPLAILFSCLALEIPGFPVVLQPTKLSDYVSMSVSDWNEQCSQMSRKDVFSSHHFNFWSPLL